jgi:hypothetical protein
MPNGFVTHSARSKPESGLKNLQEWARRHKLAGFVGLRLNGRTRQDAELLDGCYWIETDVPS